MKIKAHQRYYTSEHKQVPGATTVLNVLNKPALVKWANNLGLQGIDSSKYTDKTAEIGTIAHYLVECELKKETPDLGEYSKNDIDKAENAVLKFYDWEKQHKLEQVHSEMQLVSNQYGYGGTIDCYCLLDGKWTLIDFKTCKAIWDEHLYQLAAYRNLLIENNYAVQETKILRIGRTEDEGFEERTQSNLANQWELFKHCLGIYQIQKMIKKEG